MDQTFRAIIEVVNRASAPLHRIEADIYGLLAPIAAVGAAVAALAEETGLMELGETAALAAERVGHLGRELGVLLGPLALIGGALSAEGLLEIGKKSAEFGEKLAHSHEKTGVDIPILARLHYVAKLEDVDPEMMDKGLERLNAGLFKAMHGKNKDMDAMLTKFAGPRWKKSVRTVEDGFGLIAMAYQKAKTPFEKAGVVATAFGQKMGANMVPVLKLTRAELRALGDEFERFNGRWDDARVQQSEEAAKSWKRLSAAGEGLALTIGSAVTPSLMKLIVPLTEWIARNRELVAAKVDSAIKKIGDTLKSIDWSGIASAVSTVWGAFQGLAETLGAKGTIFLGAAVIFGPIAVSAARAAFAVGTLGVKLAFAAGRLAFIAGASVIGFFADLVTGIWLAIPALSALDLALDANPIGAIVLGLTALAGLGLLIYKNWDPLKKWFGELWAGISHDLKTAWDIIRPIIEKIEHALDNIFGHDPSKFGAATGPAEADYAAQNGKSPGWWDRWKEINRRAAPYFNPIESAITWEHDRGATLLAGQNAISKPLVDGGRRNGMGGTAANGQVDVNVHLDGLPRGARTSADASGRGLNLNVGKSFANE